MPKIVYLEGNKKVCSSCKNLLLLDKFQESNILKCGYKSQCIVCETQTKRKWFLSLSEERRKEYRQKSLNSYRKNIEKRRLQQKNRAKTLTVNGLTKAREDDIKVFGITVEYFLNLQKEQDKNVLFVEKKKVLLIKKQINYNH